MDCLERHAVRSPGQVREPICVEEPQPGCSNVAPSGYLNAGSRTTATLSRFCPIHNRHRRPSRALGPSQHGKMARQEREGFARNVKESDDCLRGRSSVGYHARSHRPIGGADAMKFAGWQSLVIEYVQAIFLFNVASSRLLTCLLHSGWRFNVERPFLTAPGRLDPGCIARARSSSSCGLRLPFRCC